MLINIIKQSSAQDVTAELNHTKEYTSNLRTALEAFRKVFAPCELKTPKQQIEYIGFIYASLLEAFKVYNAEWNNLDYDKCCLVWRQLIGFIERRLPAVERFAFAQGVDDINNGALLARALKYKRDNKNEFPVSPIDNSHSGLGFDFAVSIYGAPIAIRVVVCCLMILKNYVEKKHQDLKKLSSSCDIQMRNTK